ncbi:hypothetical protein BST96_14430 [Oceanicoccus sagamiensis]|uniref:Luciferase-like domain-containing protein n=2 Tax=Oceanicoccus sagamiensis TaxID=716816 RepID=A0A1X9NK19_9GAMM|nr:hypothetical protein BST96_14430 [Oceanicoccus sagamiensis]
MTIPGPTLTVADSIELAKKLEAEGWDDIWMADAGGLDAMTMAPLLLAATEKMRLGIAVVPVFTRTPAVLASTISVISQAFPERFVPGFGSSSHAIINNWHGLEMEKPLTRIKETMQLLRTMLAGEKTNFAGDTLKSRGYQQLPTPNQPIYLAGLRPKMVETAAEIGDGVILNLFPKSALAKIHEHIAIGAERAGKDPATIEVVSRHMIAVGEDKAMARDAFRRGFGPYYATPVYNKFLAWCGYPEAAAEIAAGFKNRDRERTAAALSDELIDEIAIIGTPDECRARVREYADAGIHTHVMAPMINHPDIIEQTATTFSKQHFNLNQ